MIKSQDQDIQTSNKFYKLQARINKCYINCQKDNMLYAVCLRFGPKMSEETAKKHPINYTMIDFNSTISLVLSKKQLISSYKCQILLLKFNVLNLEQKKQTIGISSIHITDLKQQNFRKFRLINNYDKCAIIEASIKLNQMSNNKNKTSQNNLLYRPPTNSIQQSKFLLKQKKNQFSKMEGFSLMQYKQMVSQQFKQGNVQKYVTSKFNQPENIRFSRSSKTSSKQQMRQTIQPLIIDSHLPEQLRFNNIQKYITINDWNSPLSSAQQNQVETNSTKKYSRQLSSSKSESKRKQTSDSAFYKVSHNNFQVQLNENKFVNKNFKNFQDNNEKNLKDFSQYMTRNISNNHLTENKKNIPTSIKITEKQVQTLNLYVFQKFQQLKIQNYKISEQRQELKKQIKNLKSKNEEIKQRLNQKKNYSVNSCQTQKNYQQKQKKLSYFYIPEVFINNKSKFKLRIYPETVRHSLFSKEQQKNLKQQGVNTEQKQYIQTQINTKKTELNDFGCSTQKRFLQTISSLIKFDIFIKQQKEQTQTSQLKNSFLNSQKKDNLIQKLLSQREEMYKINAKLTQQKQKIQTLLNKSLKQKELNYNLSKRKKFEFIQTPQYNLQPSNQTQLKNKTQNSEITFSQTIFTSKLQKIQSKIDQNKEDKVMNQQFQDFLNLNQVKVKKSLNKNLTINLTVSLCIKSNNFNKNKVQRQYNNAQIIKDDNSFSKFKAIGYVSHKENDIKQKNEIDDLDKKNYMIKHVSFKADVIEQMPNQSLMSPTPAFKSKKETQNLFQMLIPVQIQNNTMKIITHQIDGKIQKSKYDILNQQIQQQESQIINESIIISVKSINEQEQNQSSIEDKKQVTWSFVEYRKLNDQSQAQKFYRQNKENQLKGIQRQQRGKSFALTADQNWLSQYRKAKSELTQLQTQILLKKYISQHQYEIIKQESLKLQRNMANLIKENNQLLQNNKFLNTEVQRLKFQCQKLQSKNQKDMVVLRQMKRQLHLCYTQDRTPQIKNKASSELDFVIPQTFQSIPQGSNIIQSHKIIRKDSNKSDCTLNKKLSQKSLFSGFLGGIADNNSKQGRGMFKRQSINLHLKDSKKSCNSSHKKIVNINEQKDRINQKSIQYKLNSNNCLFKGQKQFKSQIIGAKKGFKFTNQYQVSSKKSVQNKSKSTIQSNIQIKDFQILDFLQENKKLQQNK